MFIDYFFIFFFFLFTAPAQTKYYGIHVGDFRTQAHDVRGTVYIVDERTLFVQNFHYDGQGPGK